MIQPQSAWAQILDLTCRNVSLMSAGMRPFSDLQQGVAAVRASVEAAIATRSALVPHRFRSVGFLAREGGYQTMAFVDLAQLEHEDTAVVRWVLLVHATPRAGNDVPVAYDLLQMSFDCQARRTRLRVGLSFGTDDSLVASSIELGAWEPAGQAGPVGERELDAACAAESGVETGADAGGVAATFDTVDAAIDHTRSQAAQAATRRSS